MMTRKMIYAKDSGWGFNMIEYKPVIPSNITMLFFPGSGQGGPIDGSKLHEVEVAGYPFYAKNGVDYWFNLIVIEFKEEVNNTSSSTIVRNSLYKFIDSLPNCDGVLMSGWSFGGRFVTNYVLQGMIGYIVHPKVIGCISFAGGGGSGNPVYTDLKVPYCVVHGDRDAQISFNEAIITNREITRYMATQRHEYLLIAIVGGTHYDAPQMGCNPKNVYGSQVMDFNKRCADAIATIPAPEPIYENVISSKIKNGSEGIIETDTGNKYKFFVTKI